MPRSLGLAVAFVVALVGSALAHTEQAGNLQVVHPWLTPAKHGQSAMAHATMVNTGEEPIVIERIGSSVAREVRILRDGKAVDTLQIAPGATLTPGKLRLELRDLKADLPEGKAAPVTLHLRGHGEMTVKMAIGEKTMDPDEVVEAARATSGGDSG
jgi:copper(I)-binding protein